MEKNLTAKSGKTDNYLLEKLPLLIFLVIVFLLELVYTVLVITFEGMNYVSVFIHSITIFSWNGQFNLDFSFYLIVSAFWILWRNKPGVTSFLLAIAALNLGTLFLSPYLLYLIITEKGNLLTVAAGIRANSVS